ncbi:hypothetical protein [uncultured Marinobacter sp.]|uniref:hypothetical protein n=1 Tax=uncultured Marinobacter sp. TaxID=187379 RepID=UPI002596F4A0|nr:hypothetical protein [uncultured Marinobacter sp.]
MPTAETTYVYDMASLDKVTQPTIGNLLKAQNQIAAILSDYPCNATTSGSYGHAFLIYSDTVWLTKDGITAPVVINKPATFAGTSYASRYVYEDMLKIYEDKITHQKGAIRMIKYIFPEPVFLDLCDDQGQLVGKTPQQIIQHLQDTFCDDEETEEEILKQYKIMNVKYDPSELVQVYFKALQDARTILASLNETASDKVLIRQGIDQFNKHMDLNEAVDDWKKKPSIDKTWKAFKTHFSKAITKNNKRSGTLKEIGIANQVQEQVEANRDNTETVAQFQLEQAQTIEALTTRLALLEASKPKAYGAQVPPAIITPPPSDDISQMTTILQAVMAAQTKTTQESPGGNNTPDKERKRQWNTNDNDLPNGQRSKRRHPKSDTYCHSCGYDLPPKHDSKSCKWKKDGHKDGATILNKMSGSERNCFHYKSK